MDEWFISLCFIAISTTTVLAFWFIKLSGDKASPRKKRLPPGPWTLPIIGSLHHVASVLPHRTLMQLSRRHGPLMLLRLGQVSTVVVSSAEAAELVMKTNDPVFADRPRCVTLDIASSGGKDMVFAPYGDHWRQMRKICIVQLLGSAQVSRMEGIRAEEVSGLLRDIEAAASAGATINVSEKVMALSNNIVTRAVFGGKFARQREFLREVDKAFKLMSGFCLVDMFPSSRLVRWLTNGERGMKRCHGLIHRIIAEVVENRKAARASGVDGSIPGNEDVLDVLLRLQQEDSLEFPLTTVTMGAVLFQNCHGVVFVQKQKFSERPEKLRRIFVEYIKNTGARVNRRGAAKGPRATRPRPLAAPWGLVEFLWLRRLSPRVYLVRIVLENIRRRVSIAFLRRSSHHHLFFLQRSDLESILGSGEGKSSPSSSSTFLHRQSHDALHRL